MASGPVQGAKHMGAGCAHVVDRSRFDFGYPQREAVGRRERLDVAAVGVRLTGVPRVDLLSLDAGGLLAQAVAGEQLAVHDDVVHAVVLGLISPENFGPVDCCVPMPLAGVASSR